MGMNLRGLDSLKGRNSSASADGNSRSRARGKKSVALWEHHTGD